MSEFNKLLEQIRQSDLSISATTREIRNLEAEAKKLEDDLSTVEATLRQIRADNKYKMKTMLAKEFELKMFRGRFDIRNRLFDEKNEAKKTEERKLESVKHSVWDERLMFCEGVSKFIGENDFLNQGSQKFQSAIRKREGEKSLEIEISKLEQELEKLYSELNQLDEKEMTLRQMENDRDALDKEPECGREFQRLKSRMQEGYVELEDLNYLIALRTNKPNSMEFSVSSNSYCAPSYSYSPLGINLRQSDMVNHQNPVVNSNSQELRQYEHHFVVRTPSGHSKNP